jgi:hypothetical protein
MDERPDVIENQIEATRARLDRDLDRLDSGVAVAKERLKLQAQYWAGVSAVAIGAVGALAFWPRHSR